MNLTNRAALALVIRNLRLVQYSLSDRAYMTDKGSLDAFLEDEAGAIRQAVNELEAIFTVEGQEQGR